MSKVKKIENQLTAFLIAETPLHVGGSEQIGLVDLPIQRERHTQYPKIEASSLKGSLKAAMKKKLETEKIEFINSKGERQGIKFNQFEELMGAETTEAGEKASAIAISDARILLFPVKTPNTVFAWVTSPHTIMRFLKEITNTDLSSKILKGINEDKLNSLTKVNESNVSLVPESSNDTDDKYGLVIKHKGKSIVLLEDYYLEVEASKIISQLSSNLAEITYGKLDSVYSYWKNKMKKHFVVVPDKVFTDLVINSTEIVTRIKINYQTKTVQEAGLFNEEFLPEDTIMYFAVISQKPPASDHFATHSDVLNAFLAFNIKQFQIGADATLGKGYSKIVFDKEIIGTEK